MVTSWSIPMILVTASNFLIGTTTSFNLPNRVSLPFVRGSSHLLTSLAPSSLGRGQNNDASKTSLSKTSLSSMSGDNLHFRPPKLEDIPSCFEIESASYPADEAATKESLEYRQKEATSYFRCAVSAKDEDQIIGFICSTRCDAFEEESMSTHDPDGKLLAIHSVVVKEEYRRLGVATAMMNDYIEYIKATDSGATSRIERIVLIAKSNLLGFYVNLGFEVKRPSAIEHGQDRWYDLEMTMKQPSSGISSIRSLPEEDEKWYVKTEQFCKPFPVVKPHLEAHRAWVADLRLKGYCITSGYRVDAEGKPGGGGMMFFAAKSYEEAEKLILQDPLVANECVNWTLNGWIAEVGDVQMR